MSANENWSTTITLHRAPHCPLCGEPIHHLDWVTWKGIVLCQECWNQSPRRRLTTLHAIAERTNHHVITNRYGLKWYTPTLGYPPRPASPGMKTVPYMDHPTTIEQRARIAIGR
jgi:hypothetical protein